MERLILSPQTEIFSRKRDFFKDRPKFPNGISKWKMCVLFASFYHFQVFWLDCLWSYLPRKSLGNGTSASPWKFPFRGFDTSHLLQLSANRFFRVNGKQPQSYEIGKFLQKYSVSILRAAPHAMHLTGLLKTTKTWRIAGLFASLPFLTYFSDKRPSTHCVE